MSDEGVRSVPAATKAGYPFISDFECGAKFGTLEMRHSISETEIQFGFSGTTISRMYRECQFN